jgi:hypothetical protein
VGSGASTLCAVTVVAPIVRSNMNRKKFLITNPFLCTTQKKGKKYALATPIMQQRTKIVIPNEKSTNKQHVLTPWDNNFIFTAFHYIIFCL